MTRRWPALASALVLVLAGASVSAEPPPTITREALNARVDELQTMATPGEVTGEVRLGRPADERRLDRGFLDVQQVQPDWPDEGIVVASGRYRIETVARALDRPDLLACADDYCRLAAPLAVESGAGLIIDRVELDLEARAGAAIVAHGDLFIGLATIWGRDGDRLATTEGRAFRPFITAYDASEVIVRDSRIVALGYDSFGTSGFAVMTGSRDDPIARPSLRMAASLVENLFDGLFVRGAAGVELLRTKFAGSRRNGIILRDGTTDGLVADNEVVRTGPAIDNGDGIIVSRGAANVAVLGNRVFDSSGNGIFVERGARDLTIAGNEVKGNGRDGIIVYESSGIDVLRNEVADNARSGIRVRASDNVRIERNALNGNGRVGIDLHDWSAMARDPRADELELIRPTRVVVSDNRFAENARGKCEIQGDVTVEPPGGADC